MGFLRNSMDFFRNSMDFRKEFSGFPQKSHAIPKEFIGILCASRNPTSPSKTSSCTKVAQDGAKLASNGVQKSSKNGVPHRTLGAKNGVPHRPGGLNKAKKSKKNANASKNRDGSHRAPPLVRKSGQHGPNLGPKLQPRCLKNRCKNASFF